jgi:hypothetical protein
VLDRFAQDFLRRNAETAAVADDPIHVLNPVERAGLRRVSRGAVTRAALAGVVNALLTGMGELYANHLFGRLSHSPTLVERLRHYSVYGTGLVVFAALEILYLGWDGLRSVTRLSAVAGLELSKDDNKEVALALARAALELPNPPEAVLGVNPHREASKLQLVVASAVYKLKVVVTNFVFKLIMQHTLPRVAKHFLMAFTAVPINGLWNGLVCWQVLREARIRVMGPSAASEMLDDILIDAPQPSPALALAIHRAVGSAIVRTQELHPNHVAIVRAVRQRLGEPEQGLELDDSDQFLKALPGLNGAEQRLVLRVLAVAAIIDGRLVRAEKRLLSEAYELVALPEQLGHVEHLRRAFVAGDVIEREALIAAAP